MNEFEKLGLSKVTVDILTKKGYVSPSPIQVKTIPVLLRGEHDVVGQAQTGTGKTACFALPILENLERNGKVQALILAPTRELAVQVAAEIKSLKGSRKVSVEAIYGGTSIRNQMDELKRGVEIVVGTPGRVMDLMKRKVLDISNISYAVLDEADEMLNMGFLEDIEDILKSTPTDKKMLMFSATMPKEILRIAKRFMREYEVITIEEDSVATDLIDQVYFDIKPKDRYAAVRRIVVAIPNFHGIIFCKTKIEVDDLAQKLVEDNYAAAALHGDISQAQRENILKQFKAKKIRVLIATDVAARGIDINDLKAVINYSLPQSPELYVHRIGRTGRMGNTGIAITFLIPSEKRKLRYIERLIEQKIRQGELPSKESIIESKKMEIESVIKELISASEKTEYDSVAKKLLNHHDALDVVSASLRYAFNNELNHDSYKDIDEVSENDYPKKSGGDRRSRGGKNRRGRDGRNSSSHGGSREKRNDDKESSQSNGCGNNSQSYEGRGSSRWKEKGVSSPQKRDGMGRTPKGGVRSAQKRNKLRGNRRNFD